MSKASHIAIVGCGYLGLELAKDWTKHGYHVTATTRTPEKLEGISKVTQKAVILKGNDEDELAPIISHNETIIVTSTTDNPEHYESAYLNTAQIFRRLALEMDLPRNLIYTSSASVYGDHKGMWVDETSALLGKGDLSRILIEAEKTYASLEELGWDVCIFRFAEIYGPGRELFKQVGSLLKHSLPGSGDRYTNMVHRDDCVKAIQYALRYHLTGIYNLSDDDHPTKKELYNQISTQFKLPEVKWDPLVTSLHSGNKRVSNHKIKKEGYKLIHPHRILDEDRRNFL